MIAKIIAGLVLYLVGVHLIMAFVLVVDDYDIDTFRDYLDALVIFSAISAVIIGVWLLFWKVVPWCFRTLWGI